MIERNQNYQATYNDQDRQFLRSQAADLQRNNQPCELHTFTEGSVHRGRVLQADEGGVVFQEESGSRLSVPISLIKQFVGIPVSWTQSQTEPLKARQVGAGSQY